MKAKILEIDKDRKRISLSIRETIEPPMPGEEPAAKKEEPVEAAEAEAADEAPETAPAETAEPADEAAPVEEAAAETEEA